MAGLDPARHPREVKRRVGYLPDAVGFYGGHDRAPEPALHGPAQRAARQARRRRRWPRSSTRSGLTDRADDRVETYSRGMSQRLGIADALVKSPDILILDEPTTAIDPIGVVEILDLLRGARPRARPGHPALEPPADAGPVGLRPDRDLRRRAARRRGDRGPARQPVRRRRGDPRGRASSSRAPADIARAKARPRRACMSVVAVQPPAPRSDAWRLTVRPAAEEGERPPGRPRGRGRARPAPHGHPPDRAVARRHLPHGAPAPRRGRPGRRPPARRTRDGRRTAATTAGRHAPVAVAADGRDRRAARVPSSPAGGSSPPRSSATTSSSVRFVVLLIVLGLAAAIPLYFAADRIRDVGRSAASGVPAVFLALFTLGPQDIAILRVDHVRRRSWRRCSGWPSRSTRSTASDPRARCRGSSPSRSTATT